MKLKLQLAERKSILYQSTLGIVCNAGTGAVVCRDAPYASRNTPYARRNTGYWLRGWAISRCQSGLPQQPTKKDTPFPSPFNPLKSYLSVSNLRSGLDLSVCPRMR